MIQEHPVVTRYMATFGTAIMGIDARERAAIEQEIRSHIAEATAAGRSLDEVLTALGPADALARAYSVELLMNPRDRRLESVAAFLTLAATVVVGSFATLIVVAILGSVGVSFTTSAVVVFAIGVLETSGIHLPGVQLSGVPPEWVIVLAVPFFVIGVAALALLTKYIRFVGRAMRKRLPVRASLARVVVM
jgi:uncharacterized membrane protein